MSVDGTYTIVIKSPMGEQNGTLTVATDGDSLTGRVESGLGNVDLNDGKVSGNSFSWNMDMKVPMPMTLECEATVDGNVLTGSVKAGAFGSMPMTGTRAD